MKNYRAPLIIHFEMETQGFFSDTGHQKRSLAELNEYFGNLPNMVILVGEVVGKKNKLSNKTGF